MQLNYFDIHPCYISTVHSFLLLTTIVWTYHNLFIHSTIDGHSGFWFGANVNKTPRTLYKSLYGHTLLFLLHKY